MKENNVFCSSLYNEIGIFFTCTVSYDFNKFSQSLYKLFYLISLENVFTWTFLDYYKIFFDIFDTF